MFYTVYSCLLFWLLKSSSNKASHSKTSTYLMLVLFWVECRLISQIDHLGHVCIYTHEISLYMDFQLFVQSCLGWIFSSMQYLPISSHFWELIYYNYLGSRKLLFDLRFPWLFNWLTCMFNLIQQHCKDYGEL